MNNNEYCVTIVTCMYKVCEIQSCRHSCYIVLFNAQGNIVLSSYDDRN